MTRYRFEPMWDRDSGFLPHDSLESLVCCDQISCRWVRRFASNNGIEEEYPPKKSLFYWLVYSVGMVADRQRLAAYHNKHCWRAFRGYQHRWAWTILSPKNMGFIEFFAIFGTATHISRVNCAIGVYLQNCAHAAHTFVSCSDWTVCTERFSWQTVIICHLGL